MVKDSKNKVKLQMTLGKIFKTYKRQKVKMPQITLINSERKKERKKKKKKIIEKEQEIHLKIQMGTMVTNYGNYELKHRYATLCPLNL